MITTNRKRAGIGACTAAALAVCAGLGVAPAAHAATTTVPTAGPATGLVGGVTTTVTDAVSGVLGGPTSTIPTSTAPTTAAPTSTTSSAPTSTAPTSTAPTSTAPTTAAPTSTTSTAPVGITTEVGVQLGTDPTAPLPTSSDPTGGTGLGLGLGVGLGTTTVTDDSGATGTGAVPTGSGGVPAGTGSVPTGTAPAPTGAGAGAGAPIVLSALSASALHPTVYPVKDGYRDIEVFTLHGITSDGLPHAASGTAALTLGSTPVATWPITATDQTITWDGLMGGVLVPGRYILSATVGEPSGAAVTGRVAVDVSAKKLATATTMLASRSISGTHTMAAAPRRALATGRVTLRLSSVASHVRGRQYLLISHAGTTHEVRIRNGAHTSKAVTIPKSFTTFTISHTWKKGTVRISSLR